MQRVCVPVCRFAVDSYALSLYCGRAFLHPAGGKAMQTVEIADAAAFERTLRRLAHQILEKMVTGLLVERIRENRLKGKVV